MPLIIDIAPFTNIGGRFNPNAWNVFSIRGMLPQLHRMPSICHICHRWPSQPFCAGCIERFAQPVKRCRTCALSLSTHQLPCWNCSQCPSPLDACVSAVSYTFPWSNCIARFKFQSDPNFSRALADLMRHAPWVEPALDAASLVIPMPLTLARLRERGYNQALELAKHLAPKKFHAHTLLRSGNRGHQVGASREARSDHVRDAFWIAPERLFAVRDQHVVLLDDVMTTGASLYEAARILRTAGAAHITGLVLARTESLEFGH